MGFEIANDRLLIDRMAQRYGGKPWDYIAGSMEEWLFNCDVFLSGLKADKDNK